MKRFQNKWSAIALLVLLLLAAIPFVWLREGKTPSTSAKSAASLGSTAASVAPATRSRMLPVSSASPAPTKKIWPAPAETWGVKLEPRSLAYAAAMRAGEKLKGRAGPLDVAAMASPAKLHVGEELTIPLLGGEQVTGRVQLVLPEDNGVVRVGGKLTGEEEGTFSLAQLPSGLTGRILLTSRKVAYVITPGEDGGTWLVEKSLSDVICSPYPQAAAPSFTVSSAAVSATSTASTIPILSSRPGAHAVIYIDLDGATVADPDWNGGATIVAPPYSLNATQVREIWNRVKEDYVPFDIDVTTDASRYVNALRGSRMRCIVTPKDVAAPGAGGVAYVGSFAEAGTDFSSTIPCWVFNSSPDEIAAAVSHEVGHTLGLSHDGLTSPREEYYDGHGTGLVSWGPIMGSGYYSALTQWSKGEYAHANNHEDDLAIIAGPANGFGYIVDDAGDTIDTAAKLALSGTGINQTGTISRTGDADCYAFNTGACTINVAATHATPAPNLDILLDLLDSTGNVLATANPSTETNATLTKVVVAGTYYLRVSGTGRGNVLLDGYSNYGSLGAYTLSGSIPGVLQTPLITSPSVATSVAGVPFTYQIVATNNPLSYSVSGALPDGLLLNEATGEITGTPTEDGTFTLTLVATNFIGSGSKILILNKIISQPVISSIDTVSGAVGADFSYQITAENDPVSYTLEGTLPAGLTFDPATGAISGTPSAVASTTVTIGATNEAGTGTQNLLLNIAPAPTLAMAVDDPSHVWRTGGSATWKVITTGAYDGANAVQSGKIGNKKQSWIRTSVHGPATLRFRWRVDSERVYDSLRFTIDGVQKSSISGSTAWSMKAFSIPKGTHVLQWNYVKDFSISTGQDAGYLDTVSVK